MNEKRAKEKSCFPLQIGRRIMAVLGAGSIVGGIVEFFEKCIFTFEIEFKYIRKIKEI